MRNAYSQLMNIPHIETLPLVNTYPMELSTPNPTPSSSKWAILRLDSLLQKTVSNELSAKATMKMMTRQKVVAISIAAIWVFGYVPFSTSNSSFPFSTFHSQPPIAYVQTSICQISQLIIIILGRTFHVFLETATPVCGKHLQTWQPWG
jgi:hypothetical protein